MVNAHGVLPIYPGCRHVSLTILRGTRELSPLLLPTLCDLIVFNEVSDCVSRQVFSPQAFVSNFRFRQ